jgi:hypothetical protein
MDSYTKCFHCGADYGLHHYETQQCPLHGIEETREGRKQQWTSNTFLDAQAVKLEQAAPKLLAALENTWKSLQTYGDHPIIKLEVESALRAAGKI